MKRNIRTVRLRPDANRELSLIQTTAGTPRLGLWLDPQRAHQLGPPRAPRLTTVQPIKPDDKTPDDRT